MLCCQSWSSGGSGPYCLYHKIQLSGQLNAHLDLAVSINEAQAAGQEAGSRPRRVRCAALCQGAQRARQAGRSRADALPQALAAVLQLQSP